MFRLLFLFFFAFCFLTGYAQYPEKAFQDYMGKDRTSARKQQRLGVKKQPKEYKPRGSRYKKTNDKSNKKRAKKYKKQMKKAKRKARKNL